MGYSIVGRVRSEQFWAWLEEEGEGRREVLGGVERWVDRSIAGREKRSEKNEQEKKEGRKGD